MNYHIASFKAAYGTSSQLPESTRPEVSFAGRSNVGKSSLLNKLMYRKGLAKVSQTPGKTATINFYDVDGTDFVDLPGYGYAKVAKSEKGRWSELIEGYFNQDRRFALVVFTCRHPPRIPRRSTCTWRSSSGKTTFPSRSPSRKPTSSRSKRQGNQASAIRKKLDLPKDIPFVVTSSSNGTGVDELRRLIDSYVAEA